MRRLLPIIFLLSLIPISGVHAAQWSRIATKDKVRLEVDAASIVKGEEGKVKLWHREVNPVPKVPDSGAFTFIKRTMLTEFNCAKRTTTPVQQIYTAPDGGELKAESFDGADAQPLLPDSTMEVVFNYACRQLKTEEPKPEAAKPAETSPSAHSASVTSCSRAGRCLPVK
mgnify:CR=1 FL=1